jgi:radical SAM superfamily enzyme YgiQ (UPF0313 family)
MKLNRLTLIRPNMGDFRSHDAMKPLSLGILAARTPADIQISFFDDKIEIIPEDDHPDMVAMTVETFTASRAYTIAKKYRDCGIPVVMGGYHPTFLPEEALLHADAVVRGDAEGIWEQILLDFQDGELRRIYTGGNSRLLNDVVVDRRIFEGKKYVPLELVQYGRGCHFDCDFCSIHRFYDGQVRCRTLDGFLEELKLLDKKKLLFFVDDNLFSSRNELNKLLQALQPSGFRWCCQISIDVAWDEKLLDMMAECGCVLVLIGFESLSMPNLKQMRKPWNSLAGDYREVVKKFHERNIAIYGTFVFGYDWETVGSIQESLDFAIREKLEIANFNLLIPTPGSLLYERLKQEKRLISPKWWLDPDYRYGDSVFIPKLISPDDLSCKCFEAKKTFYSWKSIAYRMIPPESDFDWFKTGIIGLANIISRREIRQKQYRSLGAS